MRPMIARPARALLPVALAACAMFGMEERALALLTALLAARGCSLCAGAAFRRASGRILSESRLCGNFITALLMCLAGGALSVCIFARIPVPGVTRYTALAGALFMLAQAISDRLYTLPDSFSAPMCDALTAVFAAVGLLMGGDFCPFIGGAAAVGVTGLVCLGVCGARLAMPGAQALASAPISMVRCWLIPAFIWLCAYTASTPQAVCAGCAAIALCDFTEAPYRRSTDESHGFNISMVALTVAAAAISMIMPDASDWSAATLIFAFAATSMVIKDAYLWHYGLDAAIVACAAYASRPAFAGMLGDGCVVALMARCIAIALMAIALLLLIPDISAVVRKARAIRLSRRRRSSNASGI